MRTINNFVFWQGAFSIHQSALLRNLAAFHGINVTLVVWEELRTQEAEKGWERPDYGQTRIIVGPSPELQFELLSTNRTATYHIFSGTRGHPMIWDAFRQALTLDCQIGIQSESQRRYGVKGFLRLLRNRYDVWRYSEKINFILGISNMSVNWFKQSGYAYDKVFPFAYFVETPTLGSHRAVGEAISSQSFDLIFVGRPLFNKGLDILLHALRTINQLDWRLHVVGDQEDRREFAELTAELGLTDSVHFYGILPNPTVIGLMAKSDLLVLPSRWDGWGAVVNEALMCGVPVVCSNRCGAADLLDGDERGEVFTSGDISALSSILNQRIQHGKKDPAISERISAWSKCLDGKVGANYLLGVVDTVTISASRPSPLWLHQNQG